MKEILDGVDPENAGMVLVVYADPDRGFEMFSRFDKVDGAIVLMTAASQLLRREET
jgi:hypothetical protein